MGRAGSNWIISNVGNREITREPQRCRLDTDQQRGWIQISCVCTAGSSYPHAAAARGLSLHLSIMVPRSCDLSPAAFSMPAIRSSGAPLRHATCVVVSHVSASQYKIMSRESGTRVTIVRVCSHWRCVQR